MDFHDDEQVRAFRDYTREILRDHLTSEMVARAHETGTMHDWTLHRHLASTGIIAEGIASTSRTGRDPLEMFAFFDELGLADAPFYGLANTMLVAGVIEQVGSEFLRQTVLPELHKGDAIVALGYTEPDSGSDVAAASTRARPAIGNAGEWIITGQKMFTTFAHEAKYVLLLTRTNTDVPKHAGLTMFLVPLHLAGIHVEPIFTLGGERTNITFYDDVVVLDRWRVGHVDGGWDVMKVALSYERGVLGNTNQAVGLLEKTVRWAAEARAGDGRPLLQDPVVRVRLARIAIDNEVTALLATRAALIASGGGRPTIEGAVAKLFASEAYNAAAERCLEITGSQGLIQHPDQRAVAGGDVERASRDAPVTTIYGGTSEIQRNLIAQRHLGLPKSE
jgi:alkylation response protein AidB-like acyl-CoA dehydrogenase